MTDQPTERFDTLAYVHAVAPMVGLPIHQGDITKVASEIARAAEFAALLTDIPKLDAANPAPIFRPREPK